MKTTKFTFQVITLQGNQWGEAIEANTLPEAWAKLMVDPTIAFIGPQSIKLIAIDNESVK